MSWEVTVTLDKDKENVGTVTAKWTDPTYGTFSITQRRTVSLAEADAFVADAIAARDEWQSKNADDLNKSGVVLDRLNTEDSQVT